ncbi:DUF6973 domain-containing protein [Nocardia asteroides]|uniref:DUF6973 domain-containing protein n=1 Tax=Nocardia asteroides TaxID=1824 RepID=UPI003664B8C3
MFQRLPMPYPVQNLSKQAETAVQLPQPLAATSPVQRSVGVRFHRRLVAGAILVFATLLGSVQGTGEAKAYGSNDLADAGDCVVLYGINCVHAQDARNWATDVTIWKFGKNGHNDMSDAFRHCSWIGAIATRIGESGAYTVGYIHESNANAPEAEFKMDDWNNFVGAGIGAAAVRSGAKDQWGYVLRECESKARGKMLYGMDGKKGNY